ncbi:hypothetical protein GRJ2_002424200 [Grus japonensis]|uniref:Uncharacterized protein n=1 Tax=Grus japonensis TaxID=30415 RepID=A0ABC9XPD3_GRUJA
MPGPPWNLSEAQDCTLPQQHPGTEGDPGAQDGWRRPLLTSVGQGCLVFWRLLGRWPACRIEPRNYLFRHKGRELVGPCPR